MARCPICSFHGELGQECPNQHGYCIEEKELEKAPEGHLLGSLVGGQYIPLSLIGEGGMGRIYRAKAKYTGKILALKILKSEYMEDETLRDRFFREAEVVSALDHPNIVKLYGCAPDEKHNTIYMAMELLEGRTLFEVLRRNVPPLEELLQHFVDISSALSEAHKNGIYHRDLKPENIFIIEEDGKAKAKVLDFGFARLQNAAKKLTMIGVAFGTPHYMSPEQAMGMTEITPAVDVYALGVMLFQVVTGKVPYDSPSNSPMEVMYDQVHKATPPIVPRKGYHPSERLIACIQKCMQKEPKDRFPSGQELHAELLAIATDIQLHPTKLFTSELKRPLSAPMAELRQIESNWKFDKTTLSMITILVLLILAIIALLSLL